MSNFLLQNFNSEYIFLFSKIDDENLEAQTNFFKGKRFVASASNYNCSQSEGDVLVIDLADTSSFLSAFPSTQEFGTCNWVFRHTDRNLKTIELLKPSFQSRVYLLDTENGGE